MPQFAWSGRDTAQVLQTGIIESSSASLASEILMARAIVPVRIDPYTAPETAGEMLSRWRAAGIGDEALLMFSRQMSTLLKAGVPILRALSGLAQSADQPTFSSLMKRLRSSLDAGFELSQAMARHPEVFDSFYLAMVRVGEQTGQLSETFASLFQHLEFQQFMRNQVKAALRYPKFVMFAMAAALVVINIFVIPQFAKVFAGFKTELPLMTRILLGFSQFTVTWWPALLGASAGAWVALRMALARPSIALMWDRMKLRLPVAGKVLRKAALARACGSMALVQRSGVPLVQGISLAAEVVDNKFMEARIKGMRSALERGDNFLSAATRAGIFTPLVLQMIMVGEESGAMDQMLEQIAQAYQRDVENDLKTMSQQIEPILIFVIGGMVLVLALGVFMPMWELGGAAIK